MSKLLPVLTAAALLAACEARIGNDAAPVADLAHNGGTGPAAAPLAPARAAHPTPPGNPS